ncbi:receptor-interacting serine/threonine-protein kinase 3-like isoform X3 [Amphiprion ocellaris]|nr:receptor-interacting serine/threonine-protein kinase 3-like isoform X3 [Amphiprion ocellaris]
MALHSHKTELVGNDSLEEWERIDSGGFGTVYKARHKDWGFDVAIKLIHHADRRVRELWDEASHMDKAACQYVIWLYGMYQGCPPKGEPSMQQGIVMEFMERGSIQSLQRDLSGPPPWPLVFRLAHQVALGMNFLHERKLLHQDLKPSNVLLNDDLNAKVADFGLSMVSTSALTSNTEMTGQLGGSFKYMPPESFEASYKPVRAFDRYSYGILLWSIVTGEEPYPAAQYSLVALRIPEGDRPNCKEIEQIKVEGLEELVDLMKQCWNGDPSKRPTFKDCREVTERVLSKHKKDIPHAVHAVLTKLDSLQDNPQFNKKGAFNYDPQIPGQQRYAVDHPRVSVQQDLASVFKKNVTVADEEQPHYTVDYPGVSVQPNSGSVPKKTLTVADKAKFISDNRAVLIQTISEVLTIAEELGEMVHPDAYSVLATKATTQDQMRVLYQRTFRSGGDVVKAAFYDALKKHHPSLVERLSG